MNYANVVGRQRREVEKTGRRGNRMKKGERAGEKLLPPRAGRVAPAFCADFARVLYRRVTFAAGKPGETTPRDIVNYAAPGAGLSLSLFLL